MKLNLSFFVRFLQLSHFFVVLLQAKRNKGIMRRLMAIILCVYVLGMMIMPCHCTEHGCEYSTQTTQEACTPFCSCSSIHGANYYTPCRTIAISVASKPAQVSFFYLMRIPHVECGRFKVPPEV